MKAREFKIVTGNHAGYEIIVRIDEDRFYTSGGYEEWCSLTGEDPSSYEI